MCLAFSTSRSRFREITPRKFCKTSMVDSGMSADSGTSSIGIDTSCPASPPASPPNDIVLILDSCEGLKDACVVFLNEWPEADDCRLSSATCEGGLGRGGAFSVLAAGSILRYTQQRVGPKGCYGYGWEESETLRTQAPASSSEKKVELMYTYRLAAQ